MIMPIMTHGEQKKLRTKGWGAKNSGTPGRAEEPNPTSSARGHEATRQVTISRYFTIRGGPRPRHNSHRKGARIKKNAIQGMITSGPLP